MKRRIRMVFMVVLSFTLLMIPGIAPAAFVELGPGAIVGSWQQQFQENGVGNYNKMEFFMLTSGVNFQAPGFSGFSGSGWSSSLVNPNYILATGTPTSDSTFYLTFTSPQSTPFAFDFLAWNDTTLRERVHASWNGGWSFAALSGEGSYDRSPVPVPGALILFGSGLLGLVGIGRKRLKG